MRTASFAGDVYANDATNDLTDTYDCVEELCIMVVDRKGDQEFTVSFDPDSQLLLEKGQVNLIKDGQGTPLADYHLLPGHRRTNCH
jgi:hypothetical protein